MPVLSPRCRYATFVEAVGYRPSPGDRFILTEQEIEQFYRGDPRAGRYRPELAGKSVCHHLQPGWAVHRKRLLAAALFVTR